MAISSKVWADGNLPQVQAVDLNNMNSEVNKSILRAGIALNYADPEQLSRSLTVMAASGNVFFVDPTSTANALILKPLEVSVGSPRLAPDKFYNLMKIRFMALVSNTGAMTITIPGIVGTIPLLVGSGAALSGQIVGGRVYEATYISGNFYTNAEPLNTFISRTTFDSNVTVTVGAGGNFTTIGAALEYLTKTYSPAYKQGGVSATINLLSGFVMAEQVMADALDLSWIKITGVDASTVVTRSAITASVVGSDGDTYRPIFYGTNRTQLPIISQTFNVNTSGAADTTITGVLVDQASNCLIASGKSITNAGKGLCALFSSAITCSSANLTSYGDRCIYADSNSTITAKSCTTATASFGVIATGYSAVNVSNLSASGHGTSGLFATTGSTITADSASILTSSTGSNAIVRANGATILSSGLTLSGAATTNIAILAERGGNIVVSSGTATGVGTGVRADNSATVDVIGFTCTGATNYGCVLTENSSGRVLGNFTGAGVIGAYCTSGSRLSISGGGFFQKGGAANNNDIVIYLGAVINAAGTTAGLGRGAVGSVVAATALTNYADGVIYR